jgi:hypothetical protein
MKANSIPTWKLKEILTHPHTQGIDGADYGPVKEELEQELWQRAERDLERMLHQYEQQQKAYIKHQATSHKRRVTA